MGFFDKLKGEFIDIIEWPEQGQEVMVHRFERHNNEIKYGAKLIVRPGQKAVFVNEGEIADVFEPGTFELYTRNLPVLSTLQGWKHGFESPFKAEVYFIDTRDQLDRKWGTPHPITLRDADFGAIRLRCRGNYSYRITTDKDLITKFVGAQSSFSSMDIEGQIRTQIISSFSDALAELKIPALDLPSKYEDISKKITEHLQAQFKELGLELIRFVLENIALPEEVEKAIDERGSVAAHQGMANYTAYQHARATRDAANNEGTTGSMMGMMVGGQLGGGLTGVGGAQIAQILCPTCNAAVPQGSKFCSGCGNSLQTNKVNCVHCTADIEADSKFCNECGKPQALNCSNCKTELAIGTKFCSECGTKQE